MSTFNAQPSVAIGEPRSQDVTPFILSFDINSPPSSPPLEKRLKGGRRVDNMVNGGDCMYTPSDETMKESLAGEHDVWMCNWCRHLNSGGRGICGLCWEERTAFLDVVEPEEDYSFIMSPNYFSSMAEPSLFLPEEATYPIQTPRISISPIPDVSLDFSRENVPSPSFQTPSKLTSFQMSVGSPSFKSGYHGTGYESTGSSHFDIPPPGSSPLSNSLAGNRGEGSCAQYSSSGVSLCHKATESVDSSIDDEEDDSYYLNLPNQAGPFVCPYPQCEVVMEDSRTLHVHVQQHKWGPHRVVVDENGVPNYVCCQDGCEMMFDDKKILKKHMLAHREKVFACHYPDCERKFYERAKLKRHFLVHTGEKPFVCPFDNCGKKFGYNANLKTHLRTHTGSRPFPCTVLNCRRRFAQASNRNIHVLTHERTGGAEDMKEYEGEPMDDKKKMKYLKKMKDNGRKGVKA